MRNRIDRLAIFDIDGTLHKTEVMSVKAHQIVMKEFGLPAPTKEKLFSTYGADTETILDMLGVVGSREYRKTFQDRMELEERRQMIAAAQCYEGVLDSLHKLHRDNVSLALCSMCDAMYMETFIRKFALQDLIVLKRNESFGPDKRLLLQDMLQEAGTDRAVMVGDRVFDLEAAKYCGIPFIGCLYGYNPEEVEREPYLAKSGADLYGLVKRVLSEPECK